MGIVGSIVIVGIIVTVGFVIFNLDNAFGYTTEWKSEILIGILESDFDEPGVDINVITTSNDSVKLEWMAPDVQEDYEIVEYKIMRRTLDTNYVHLENTNSFQTYYYDMNLPADYYGYKVIAVSKPMYEPISMHGIDRNHLFFEQYSKGQELLAYEFLKQNYPQYLMAPFQEINNIKLSPQFEHYERYNDVKLQKSILNEMIKAEQAYERLYDALDPIVD